MTDIRTNSPRRVDRLQYVNDPTSEAFKHPVTLEYMRVLVTAVRTIEADMLAKNTAAPELLLISPGGLVFRVRVDDTGALSAVRVRG